MIGHQQENQEAQKHQLSGNLDDLGYQDGDFVICTQHMIPFLNY